MSAFACPTDAVLRCLIRLSSERSPWEPGVSVKDGG